MIDARQKDHILYDSLYMNFKKMQKYSDRRQITGSKDREVRGRNWSQKGKRELFQAIQMLYLIISITVYICQISTNSTVHTGECYCM